MAKGERSIRQEPVEFSVFSDFRAAERLSAKNCGPGPSGSSGFATPPTTSKRHASGYRATDRMAEISGGSRREVQKGDINRGSDNALNPTACTRDSACAGLVWLASVWFQGFHGLWLWTLPHCPPSLQLRTHPNRAWVHCPVSTDLKVSRTTTFKSQNCTSQRVQSSRDCKEATASSKALICRTNQHKTR